MRALTVTVLALASAAALAADRPPAAPPGWDALVALDADFRSFLTPSSRDGAPDFTAATTAARCARLPEFRARLTAIDAATWPVASRVDWELVRAELNGFDFDCRVLRPWERDPAWYRQLWQEQSDTPAHEGPTNPAVIDVWKYAFPLSPADASRLAAQLSTVPPFLAQARTNLTGNARDLWLAGAGTMRQQSGDLAELEAKVAGAGRPLRDAVRKAKAATDGFVAWLDAEAPKKTGPSGVGKENYTWVQQNVHLVPWTWDEEKALLERELARAHAGLLLEEVRNRDLPPLPAISSPAEYDARAKASVDRYLTFLEKSRLLTVRPWMAPQMNAHLLSYVPPEKREFFITVNHYEPLALFTHWYHWWDHGRMENAPHASPIRREPLPFNIWDNRSEGTATAIEEIVSQAGLYDDQPRARELVWIMLAARAARGLASLHAQANEFTMKEASDFHVEWIPRGWMKRDNLLGFEQQLYLRQPGYGTSYITGKILLDELMQARAKQLGPEFTTMRFFEEYDRAGLIPVSAIRLELTGEGCCRFGAGAR
jgi:hypothetical protein